MVETVLLYLEQDGKYLMLYRNKKKKDINKGKWIGIGGHIEEGETKEEALVRECKEETSLNLLSYSLRGKLVFVIDGYEETCYLYTSSSFEGKIQECDEGELSFVAKEEIFHLPAPLIVVQCCGNQCKKGSDLDKAHHRKQQTACAHRKYPVFPAIPELADSSHQIHHYDGHHAHSRIIRH